MGGATGPSTGQAHIVQETIVRPRRSWTGYLIGVIVPFSSGDQDEKPTWPWLVGAIIMLGFIAYVLFRIYAPHAVVTTDDAQVTAHYATVAPRVSGQIVSVEVNDNQMVHKGQVLAILDDRDYRTAVDRAQAQLDKDLAEVANADATIRRQPAVVDQSSAQFRQAQARLSLANENATRYNNLAATGSGSRQDQQQAVSTKSEQQSRLDEAGAAVRASQRQGDILRATRQSALAAVEADRAALAQARLNLGYTRIVAPVDGMIGQRAAEAGNYVAPGTSLMVVVPLGETYVEANYREVALRHVAPGQHVKIHVDAYDVDFDGIVDSIPPSTGAAFSPVGAENATGNFTKIVQRLPVKILFAPHQSGVENLRLGMSVETSVDTAFAKVIGRSDTPARGGQ
jgi:membrane fusion protein (multidrug efflux system)